MSKSLLQQLGFESEKQFFDAAIQDRNKYEVLRQYCRTLAKKIAKGYTETSDFSQQELDVVGMSHFEKAFHLYKKRWQSALKAPYKFSSYFGWWIKHDIERFIDEY